MEQLLMMTRSRDSVLITRLLALTFAARRSQILKLQPSPVQELIKAWPAMLTSERVI